MNLSIKTPASRAMHLIATFVCSIARSIARMPGSAIRWPLVLLLVIGLSACERDGVLLGESQYQAALVGDWQGTVGDELETMRFRADGSFTCQVLSTGFIGSTLSQGNPGTIRGSWTLQGNVITLNIESATGEQPSDPVTTSSIVSFHQDTLVIKNASGASSTFVRVI